MFGRSRSRARKKAPERGIGGLKISAPTPINAINVSGNYIDLRAAPQGERVQQTSQPLSGHSIQPQPRPFVADISSESAGQPWLARSRSDTAPSVQDYPRGQPQPVTDREDVRGRSGVSQVAAFDHKPSTPNSNSRQRPRRPSSPASVIHSPPQSERDQYRGHLTPEPGSSRSVTPNGTPNGTKNFSRKIEASSTEEFYLPRGRVRPPPPQVAETSRTDFDLDFDQPTQVTKPLRRSISLDDDSRGRARQRTTQHLYEKRYLDLPEQAGAKSTESASSVLSPSGNTGLYSNQANSEHRQTPEGKRATPSSSIYSRSPSPAVKPVAVPQQYPHIAEVRRLQTPEHPPPQHLQPQFQPRGRADSKPEQLHSVAFFEGGAREPELPPVSPLLPSPPRRRRAQSIEAEKRFVPVSPASSAPSSPEFRSTANGPPPSLPPLDLADLSSRNNEDLTRLTHLFASDADNHHHNSNANMPGLLRADTGSLRGHIISSPTSPDQNKLPAYLGRLENIQKPQEPRSVATPTPPLEPEHEEQPQQHYTGHDEQMEQSTIVPKRSFSRKVSTKLRTLVGARRAGPEGRNTPSPVGNSPRGRFNKDAISSPIPIPEGEEPIDPQIEQIRAQFDIEASSTARSPRAVVAKVDDWNYSPSAATSKSSLSSVQNAGAQVAANASGSLSAATASGVRPSYMSMETATVESEVSGITNPGLSSHRSSVRSSERNITPDSEPMTPLDNELAFSALRGTKPVAGMGDTVKSDTTVRPQQPSIPTYSSPGQQSVEVPVFLDTTSDDHDARTSVSSKREPESKRAEYASSRVNSIMTSEVEKQLEQRKFDQLAPPRLTGRRRGDSDASSGSNSSADQDRSALLSPVSTAPSSVPPSPLPPISPLPPLSVGSLARKPSTARPPFAGGKKPLLRAATMSSRSGGGGSHARPMKPTKMQTNTPAPIMEAEDSSPPRRPNPARANTIDHHHPAVHVKPSPKRRQFSRRQELQDEAAREPKAANRTFSFAQSSTAEDTLCLGVAASEIHPDDSISRIGSAEPSPVSAPVGVPPPPSPTPFHVDRSLPRRPTTTKRPTATTHPNTATLNTLDTPAWQAPPPTQSLQRSDTDWQPQLPLRPAKSFSTLRPAAPPRVAALSLNTSVPAAPTTLSAGAMRPQTPDLVPHLSRSNTTALGHTPSIKKSKSYGDGLRRAFSRRAPPVAAPPLPPHPSPPPFPRPEDDNPSNPAAIGLPGGSEASLARWNTTRAMTRSRSTSRAPTPLSRPGTSSAGTDTTTAAAVKLTAELRHSIIHKPGTLFLKTVDSHGEVRDHYLKPRKGGVDKKCGFCGKGPFANMWLCLDDGCGFVVCRMCCNEKVQAEEAELF